VAGIIPDYVVPIYAEATLWQAMTADGPALRARKVAIVGSGGSGKSALAHELGPAMSLDVYHLDAMFWKPGWVRTPKDEWRSTIEELVGRDSWLIDGNYAGTMEMRLAAADTIEFLDLPRTICMWHALKRMLLRFGRRRPDMAPECPETFSWEFSRWIWDYPTNRRPGVLNIIGEHSVGRSIFVLKNPSEVRRFVRVISEVST